MHFFFTCFMTYGDNEQCSKSKVQRENTNRSKQAWTPKKLEIGLGAMEERAFSC